MYTLMFIGYVILSLLLTWMETKEYKSASGSVHKGLELKGAFVVGFSIIPVLGLIGIILYWALRLMFFLLVEIFEAGYWIYYNMP